MQYIIGLIVIALVIVGVLAIIMKITNSIPYANMVLMFVSAVALIIISFTAKGNDDNDITFKTIIWQYVCFFCYLLFMQADYAFDTEEYLNTQVYDHGDHYSATTKVDTSSNFWGVIGVAFLLSAIGLGAMYLVLGAIKNSMFACHAIGWVGAIAVGWFVIRFVRFLIKYIRIKTDRNDYYR